MPRLTHPWFEAEFLGGVTEAGHRGLPSIDGAQGVFFWCPCGYGKPEYPLDGDRPHGVIVSFANPRNAPPVPANAGSRSRGGGPSRWQMIGSGLHDLTLSPSVAVGTPECWHGWIQNGEVK